MYRQNGIGMHRRGTAEDVLDDKEQRFNVDFKAIGGVGALNLLHQDTVVGGHEHASVTLDQLLQGPSSWCRLGDHFRLHFRLKQRNTRQRMKSVVLGGLVVVLKYE